MRFIRISHPSSSGSWGSAPLGGGGQLPTDPTDPQDRKSAEFRNLVDLPGAQAAAQRGGGTCSWLSGLRLGGNAGKYTEQIK